MKKTKQFNCKVKVIDMIMGSGKTSAAINFINQSDDEQKFLYITPYLKEVKRVQQSCPSKRFEEPKEKPSKREGMKRLINKGKNVVSTHALFRTFDNELIDMCKAQNYTLIMDEVADVAEPYSELSDDDIETLFQKYVDIDEETGLLIWRESATEYDGMFDKVKRLCELGSLACYENNLVIWLFPVEAFNAFENVYILTYMFGAQTQRYYYDFFNLPYDYIYVCVDSIDNYRFTDDKSKANAIPYDFKNLIHICDEPKMNQVGDNYSALSKNWYKRNYHKDGKENIAIKTIQRNTSNFIRNKCGAKSKECMWTTFKDYEKLIKGKGFSNSFLSLNSRATNAYKNRTSVAYLVNRFMNPDVKQFFNKNKVFIGKKQEEQYALSEMLQFIWRSAVRDGKEIQLYIPSSRMRNLLVSWIEENSVNTNETEVIYE